MESTKKPAKNLADQPRVEPTPEPLLSVPPAPPTGLEPYDQAVQPTTPSVQPAATYEKRNWLIKLLKWAGFVFLIWLVALILNALVFQSYFVEGTSMEPTLQDGDRLIVNKVPLTLASIAQETYLPGRGEIVIIDSSNLLLPGSGHPEQIIKRVIGLPGDRVLIRNGEVTIYNQDQPNGFKPDQLLDLDLDRTYVNEPIDIKIPAGEIFVMGDNRAAGGSLDSREFGTIPVDEVVGQLTLRILPINSLRVF